MKMEYGIKKFHQKKKFCRAVSVRVSKFRALFVAYMFFFLLQSF